MAKKAGSGGFNKSALVREALSKGIESPAKIAAYAKEVKGKTIDPKYISVIKSNLRAKERGGKAGVRGGRTLGRETTNEASMFALRHGSIDKAKKALDGVRSDPVLAFAISMGGVDRAIAVLNKLSAQLS